MVGMLVGNNNFRNVRKFWVGYGGHGLEGRFENGKIVVYPFPGVYQDIGVMSSDEVSVSPYHIDDEHLRDIPRLEVSLHTLQSEFAPVLGKGVNERSPMTKPRVAYLPDQGL